MTLRLGGDGAITGCTSLEEPTISISGLTMTTPIEAISGTAAAPSYTFSGDTDNGLYYAGTNSIGLSTAGANAILIDSTGNVGIGTTSPGYKCDIDVTGSALRLNSTTSQALLVISSDDAANAKIEFGDESDNDRGAITYDNPNNALIFQVNAAERARIDSSGNVGIGTTSPSTAITQFGGSAKGLAVAQSQPVIALEDTSATTYAYFGLQDNNVYLDNTANGFLRFATNNTEQMRIDSSGNVGISNTSPSSHPSAYSNLVVGSGSGDEGMSIYASSTSSIRFADSTSATPGLIGYYHPTDSMTFYTNTNERMRIDSSGSLLVNVSSARTRYLNTTAYGALMNLEGTSNSDRIVSFVHNDNSGGPIFVLGASGANQVAGSNALVASNATYGLFSFQGADGTDLVEGARISAESDGTPAANSMPGRLQFYTTANGASSPTERMRIDSAGSCLFHKTTTANIQVDGFEVRKISGGSQLLLTASDNGTPAMYINNRYGAGTQQAIQFYFGTSHVGSIQTTSSSTLFTNLSDYRVKENIVDITDGITRLKQLAPKSFNFIVDPNTAVDGFLAHEAQAVVPEAVSGTKDEVDDDGNPIYQGIDQSKLVPLLTAALQEAIAKIETLEQRLSDAGIA